MSCQDPRVSLGSALRAPHLALSHTGLGGRKTLMVGAAEEVLFCIHPKSMQKFLHEATPQHPFEPLNLCNICGLPQDQREEIVFF